MVFESIIVSALNPILGKYIEDLDAGQLRVGILGGDIKLNKVKLKKNILSDLNLPITVHTGGSIKLVIFPDCYLLIIYFGFIGHICITSVSAWKGQN